MQTLRPKRILIVEDEILISKLTKAQLEKLNYEVLVAQNENEALAILTKYEVEMVLMDINLGPGEDGVELSKKIINHSNLPVIFLTSYSEREMLEKTYSVESYGYVRKNSGIELLDSTIKMAFKLFRANNQIKESESVLNSFFNSPGAIRGIIERVSDVDFKVIKVNNFISEFLGISAEAIENHNATEIGASPEGLKFWLKAMDKAKESGEPYVFDFKYNRNGIEKCFKTYISHFNQNSTINDRFSYTLMDITPEKEIEEKGKREAEHLKLAHSSIKAGIWDWDIINNIYSWSVESFDLFGIDKSVSPSYDLWYNILHPEDRDSAASRLMKCIKEKRNLNNDYRIILPNGDVRWIWTQGKIFFKDDTPLRVIGLSIDVTDLRESEKERIEVENRLSLLSNNISNGMVYQIDSGTDGNLRDFTFISKTIDNLHEITMQEFIEDNMSIYKQVIEPDTETLIKMERYAFDTMTPFKYELKFLLPSGKIRWGLLTSTPRKAANGRILWDGVELDITDQKIAEEKRKELETQLTLLSNNLNNGLVYQVNTGFDGSIRKFVFISKTVEKLHEVTVEQVLENPNYIYGQIIEPSLEELIELENNSIQSFTPFSTECKLLLPSGKTRWGLFTSTPRKSGNGELVWDGVELDITTQKENEQQIIKLVEEKELLLREVHHRIKNNMATLDSILYFHLSKTQNKDAIEIIKEIRNRIHGVALLYQNLGLKSNFKESSLKDYFGKLCQHILDVSTGGKNINIICNVEEIILDANTLFDLGIILNELMTNSMKYAFEECDNGILEISAKEVDDEIQLIIRDNGPGIPELVHTNKPSGFGHTLVDMIVEQLNGTFTLVNDNGAKCILTFKKQLF